MGFWRALSLDGGPSISSHKLSRFDRFDRWLVDNLLAADVIAHGLGVLARLLAVDIARRYSGDRFSV